MRIFVALKISPELQSRILRWQKRFSRLPVRWIAARNLHITLVPPWEESVGNIESVREKLALVATKYRPFFVDFNRITFGPLRGRPRMIWLVGEPPRELIRMRGDLLRVLRKRLSLNEEFNLHITLARFKSKESSNFPVKKMDEMVRWREKFTAINILRSQLSPKGSEYSSLSVINFRSSNAHLESR